MLTERLWVIILMLAVTASANGAGVYKWTDAQGNIHYGERPPPGREAESMEVDKAPIPREEAEIELEKLNIKAGLEPMRDGDESASQKQVPDQEAKTEDVQRRRRNCQIARENLARLERYRRLLTRDEEGNPMRLDEQARASRMVQAREHIAEFCD